MEAKKISPETKICKDPDCEHGGKPQPVNSFQVNHHRRKAGLADIRLDTCRDCMSRKRAAGRAQRAKCRAQRAKCKVQSAESKTEKRGNREAPEVEPETVDPAATGERPEKAPGTNRTKNKLHHLNDHLFAAIERLNDEDLRDEALTREIGRAKAISNVAMQIISNARLAVQAMQAINDNMIKRPPEMLGLIGYEDEAE